MHSSQVTFRRTVLDETVPLDQRKEVETIEIPLPSGDVAVLPVTDVDPDSGQRYCDLYGAKYAAFKSGEPDADRVAQLKGEIAERQAELDAMQPKKEKPVAETRRIETVFAEQAAVVPPKPPAKHTPVHRARK